MTPFRDLNHRHQLYTIRLFFARQLNYLFIFSHKWSLKRDTSPEWDFNCCCPTGVYTLKLSTSAQNCPTRNALIVKLISCSRKVSLSQTMSLFKTWISYFLITLKETLDSMIIIRAQTLPRKFYRRHFFFFFFFFCTWTILEKKSVLFHSVNI